MDQKRGFVWNHTVFKGFYNDETQMPTTKSEIQTKYKLLNSLELILDHVKWFLESTSL